MEEITMGEILEKHAGERVQLYGQIVADGILREYFGRPYMSLLSNPHTLIPLEHGDEIRTGEKTYRLKL